MLPVEPKPVEPSPTPCLPMMVVNPPTRAHPSPWSPHLNPLGIPQQYHTLGQTSSLSPQRELEGSCHSPEMEAQASRSHNNLLIRHDSHGIEVEPLYSVNNLQTVMVLRNMSLNTCNDESEPCTKTLMAVVILSCRIDCISNHKYYEVRFEDGCKRQ